VPFVKAPTVLVGLMNCAALVHGVQVTSQKRISIETAVASELDTGTNLARESGYVAFGSSSLGGYCTDTGAGTGTRTVSGIHCWDNVFDGLLGNSYSWIPGTSNGFVGVRLPSVGTVDGFRVSRTGVGGCCSDRIGGTYEVQYTLDEADHTTTSWTSAGSFTRGSYGFLYFKFSTPVTARSLRLIASDSGACIDEWELYGTAGAPATPSPTPSPTPATPSNGIAADVTNADGTWTPVAIISASNNAHASTGAVAGVKLSDADITALMQAGGDVVRLECGPCDAYFQAPLGSSWCSDCTRAMGNKLEECSLVSTGLAGPFQSSGYNNCHKGADCWQQAGGPIYEDCGGNGCNCNGAGRVAGTLYVKASGPSAVGGAAAVGDPHLQNVHGERFDLMTPGTHVLINIPRGVDAEKSLLRVQADARHLGGQCADMYFQEVNVTGSWTEARKSGGYHYSVKHGDVETPEWVAFGKVGLKVVHGRTDGGLPYLNVYVKHLGRAGFAVGGLLGEDDHEDVITPSANCAKSMSLYETGEGDRKAPSRLSVAEASLA